jgi:hypothetical protein
MNWLSLFTAVAWVDFVVIVLSKFVHLTNALNTWYKDFGLVAVGSDILIIVLGIALAQLVYPGISGIPLITVAILIQLLHDIAFYFIVIRGVPDGQNRIRFVQAICSRGFLEDPTCRCCYGREFCMVDGSFG